jgi:hypothetical protein
MIRVGYGSLPQYRSDEEAIHICLTVGSSQVHIRDNFIFATNEAANWREAYGQASGEVNLFLQHLSLSHGGAFTFRPLIIEADDGTSYPVPTHIGMGMMTVYNLERLRQDIKDTQKYQTLSDQKLERALAYLTHARYLYAKRLEIADPLSEHFTMLIASIFLNLWKAASVVVGDPSKPSDSDYQKRYWQLGFDDDFFEQKLTNSAPSPICSSRNRRPSPPRNSDCPQTPPSF